MVRPMADSKQRLHISTNSPWERQVGYARAVRVSTQIFVSGTTALNSDGHLVGIGDAYEQARQILRTIAFALNAAKLEDVVRTRIYVVNIAAHADDIGRAHGEVFGAIRPASTMVEVSRLIDPRMLVEIEAHAIASLD